MNVREMAVDAVAKILKENAYSNITINDYLNYSNFNYEDRKLFTNLVYGTVENKIYIDFLLKPFLKGKQIKPWVKDVLRLSIYQLEFLSIPPYAVINEAVEMTKKKDFMVSKLVNGVLRNYLRTEKISLESLSRKEQLSIRYSYPLWMVDLLESQYGLDMVEQMMIASSKVLPTSIRINPIKTTKDEVKQKLDHLQIDYKDSTIVQNGLSVNYPVQILDIFLSGAITIQDFASQMVAEAMRPTEHDVILDACSAPGGKSAHLSHLTNNNATIYACDIHPHKIEIMEKGFKRLGCDQIKLIEKDARELNEVFEPKYFDKILIDAPCSGLGVLSHKSEIKYTMTQEKIKNIKQLQKELLESLKELVREGGSIYYSTCTINQEENQKQTEQFLKQNQNFEKVMEKVILPIGDEPIDGFYICQLRRRTI